jgi:hypothetical protein
MLDWPATISWCDSAQQVHRFCRFLTENTALLSGLCCSLRSYCLQDGQLVTFSEVVGMTQLNGHKPVKVKNCKVGAACRGPGDRGCTDQCCWLVCAAVHAAVAVFVGARVA